MLRNMFTKIGGITHGFAGLLSKGTVLTYKDGATTKTVAAVKSIPALGSDPEKVDVTHLGSERKLISKVSKM